LECSSRKPSCPTRLYQGLAGFWQFENNTRDNSGNDKHGTRENDSQYVSGVFGHHRAALDFDGNDDIVKVSDDVLGGWTSNGSGMTVTAWVNVDGPGDTSWNRFVDVQNGSNADAHTLYWDADDTKYGFSTPAGDAVLNANITQDRWVHLAGVVDNVANETRLYVNGSYQTNDSGASSWEDLTVSIGSRYDAPTADPVNATIDQVRVYDRALNDSEIASFTNSSCNNRQRTIECIESPDLCNTSAYGGPSVPDRYYCNYGQFDTPDENGTLQDKQSGTGVCCPPDYDVEWDSSDSEWVCSEHDECKTASKCPYNITNNEDAWFNSTSDGSSNRCNSQVPDLHVNTDEQPKPERRSQACCYVPKDGRMGYYYKDGNVQIFG
jgi:hypothetical protein